MKGILVCTCVLLTGALFDAWIALCRLARWVMRRPVVEKPVRKLS